MFQAYLTYAWATSPSRLAVAAGVTLGFSFLARALRGVNPAGAVAGGLVCFLLFASAGPGAFATLVTLFLVTWISTRLGRPLKAGLGLAEPREGRNAWQVLGNLSVAAVAAIAFATSGNRSCLVAFLAALAEAATDTAASEIGQYRSIDARMVTTWDRVPAGTDGAITFTGTMAGLGAGLLVSASGLVGGMLTVRELWIPVGAGFGGMLVDSLLGATIQRRGWISNQAVNFIATAAAAAFAYLAYANFSGSY